ncbi:MAG: hypothetical protein KME42_05170 [Tildeniella nuda ZEHNDER 1965/U140]|jgi:DNA mismatch repair ATPase MutS|nr:hypothetical protein [Tildeniella nuda ZEHNDER 1965/U140]
MTNITRDEFETVKELLGSAARYAESAHRGLDRLEMMQQHSQEQIDQLIGAQRQAEQRLDRLEMTQQRSQLQIDQLTVKMDQLAEAQNLTNQRVSTQIEELAKAEKRTDQRLESFIFESQRLITKHSESIEQLKGMTERLDGVLAYLIRKEGRDE